MSRRRLLGQREWASSTVGYWQIARWSHCTNLHSSQHGWGRGSSGFHARWHSIWLDVALCQSDGCEIASPWFKLALYSLRVRLNISRVLHAALFLTQDRCWSCLNTDHGMTKRQIRETKASRGKCGETSKDTVEGTMPACSLGWGGDWQRGDAHLWSLLSVAGAFWICPCVS